MIRLRPQKDILDAPSKHLLDNAAATSSGGVRLGGGGEVVELLGSDGETSDYQRSTPSPRDTDSRINELGREDCLSVMFRYLMTIHINRSGYLSVNYECLSFYLMHWYGQRLFVLS